MLTLAAPPGGVSPLFPAEVSLLFHGTSVPWHRAGSEFGPIVRILAKRVYGHLPP